MSTGAPCGACKFLRRKCVRGCVFAPYFLSEHGTDSFCAVHKVFGASNVSKLLLRIPLPEQRRDAVFSIKYEAQARLKDPIYGCVRTIFALERQVEYLQTELQFVRAQLCSQVTASALYPQGQQLLQSIATAPPSPATPCGSFPSFNAPAASHDTPTAASWVVPCNSPSKCGSNASSVIKDETSQMNAINYILGMSSGGPNQTLASAHELLDTLQKSGVTIGQQNFANEEEFQALAQALL